MRTLIEVDQHKVSWLRRRRQRSVRLNVNHIGEILVTSGMGCRESEVKRFVREQSEWLQEVLERVARARAANPPQAFEVGETFLFLGRPRRLEQFAGTLPHPEVQVRDDVLHVAAPRALWPERIRAYYLERARAFIPSRVQVFAQLMGVFPSRVTLRCQKTRWGSCSRRGWINLNLKLMAAPLSVIDYVVIHELCHLEHPNHSPRFWRMVERYCPHHHEARRWLREHQLGLEFLTLPVPKERCENQDLGSL